MTPAERGAGGSGGDRQPPLQLVAGKTPCLPFPSADSVPPEDECNYKGNGIAPLVSTTINLCLYTINFHLALILCIEVWCSDFG